MRVSSLEIPEDVSLRRGSRRPPELRQPGYDEAYDDTVIFYDVFRWGDRIGVSGPPLMGFRELIESSRFLGDGEPITDYEFRDRDRVQSSWLHSDARETLVVSNELFTAELAIGTDDSELFRDRRALVAISQDNHLLWIRDWLRFHHEMHGVDAVVLYDNASRTYRVDELLDAVRSVPGIEVGLVVEWPFKFGPGPGKPPRFDSAWCQHGVLEHAHWRFLRQAHGVINADIDELVVTDDDRPVFDHAEESATGVLRYRGVWVEPAADVPPTAETVRYRDFRYVDPGRPRTTAKWTLIPRMLPPGCQWRLHNVVGVEPSRTKKVRHRHFEGLNTGWRYDTEVVRVDRNRHREDQHLARLLDQVFPGGRPSLLARGLARLRRRVAPPRQAPNRPRSSWEESGFRHRHQRGAHEDG
ncbi:MAG TPA: hypothetical protein VFL69_13780 [Marmoricola sp.]|nr:hypothetical protein [Marmoricola sp.]